MRRPALLLATVVLTVCVPLERTLLEQVGLEELGVHQALAADKGGKGGGHGGGSDDSKGGGSRGGGSDDSGGGGSSGGSGSSGGGNSGSGGGSSGGGSSGGGSSSDDGGSSGSGSSGGGGSSGSDDSGSGGSGNSGGGDDSGGDSGTGGGSGGGDDSGGSGNDGSSGSDDSGGSDDGDSSHSGRGGSGSDDSGGDDNSGGSNSGSDDDNSGKGSGDDESLSNEDNSGRGNARDDAAADDLGSSSGSGRGGSGSGTTAVARSARTTISESRGREIVPGEVLAVGLNASAIRSAVARGFTVRDQRGLTSLGLVVTTFGAPPGVGIDEARQQIQALAPGRAVDLHDAYTLEGESCEGDACWSTELIGWPAADPACGAGRKIGMIDTAVNASQPSLAGQHLVSRRFVPDGGSAVSGHGSAIASILVGTGQGPAAGLLPSAELLAADVFGRQRNEKPRAGALDIAAALDWLAGERVGVINMSLAGPDNAVLAAAISEVVARGVPIVAAAGNNGPSAPPAYPAAYPGVLAVTAVDIERGIWPKANHGSYVDFAAPGVDLPLLGAEGSIVSRSGTSYAAAFLTAAVAIMEPGGAPDAVESLLAKQAVDLGARGRDPVFGWGMLRVDGICRVPLMVKS